MARILARLKIIGIIPYSVHRLPWRYQSILVCSQLPDASFNGLFAIISQEEYHFILHEQKGRVYIANTPANVIALKHQAEKGKKYRNSLHHKIISPKPEFYELSTRKQILDIISNLEIHREIPRQYSYMDGGATSWDTHAHMLLAQQTPNNITSTIKLLEANRSAIDQLIQGYERINIIDICPGNGLPVKDFLAYLLQRNIPHRYIGDYPLTSCS